MRALWRRSIAPLLLAATLRARSPTRLVIAPQDIRTADPTVAADIYAGYFAFGGKVVNAHGQSPFEIEPPSPAWAATLHGFGWLRHLRAADTALARANARALVDDWMGQGRRRNRPVADEPVVIARRLLSWLSQSPLILDGADGPFYRRLMRSLGRQAALLQHHLRNGLSGDDRLWATLALTEVGICAEGLPQLQRVAARNFLEEIGRQILADGGHVSRNPQALADLLLDLLPIRQAYAARGAEVPAPLLNAVDRMMPMLRMFRHPDGGLALFNGMGTTRPELLATVLAYDDARALPLGNAPYSGYQRVEAGAAVLICDAGGPPPLPFSRRAHAGTLSFEFSSGQERLIVNCGAPDPGRQDLLRAARLTAAHSTLVLADTSSSRVLATRGLLRDLDGLIATGPKAVTVTRTDTASAAVLDMTHDGYAALGWIHRRRLLVAPDGGAVLGEDHLLPVQQGSTLAPRTFAIRFHLHPQVQAGFESEGVVALTLGNGERWRFEAGGLPVEVEESIFFASAEGPRRTEQIVVTGDTGSSPIVAWSLTRTRLGFEPLEETEDDIV